MNQKELIRAAMEDGMNEKDKIMQAAAMTEKTATAKTVMKRITFRAAAVFASVLVVLFAIPALISIQGDKAVANKFCIIAYALEGDDGIAITPGIRAELPFAAFKDVMDTNIVMVISSSFKITGENIKTVTISSLTGRLWLQESGTDLDKTGIGVGANGLISNPEQLHWSMGNPKREITYETGEGSVVWIPTTAIIEAHNSNFISDPRPYDQLTGDTVTVSVTYENGETESQTLQLNFNAQGVLVVE